jgi:hypothetical protein
LLNFNFFRPDIWYSVNDSNLETGARWDEAKFSSLPDYWPNFGHEYPDKISDGKYINYFPGWNRLPSNDGLILAEGAKFSDTPIRMVGNIISLVSVVIWAVLIIKFKNAKNT